VHNFQEIAMNWFPVLALPIVVSLAALYLFWCRPTYLVRQPIPRHLMAVGCRRIARPQYRPRGVLYCLVYCGTMVYTGAFGALYVFAFLATTNQIT